MDKNRVDGCTRDRSGKSRNVSCIKRFIYPAARVAGEKLYALALLIQGSFDNFRESTGYRNMKPETHLIKIQRKIYGEDECYKAGAVKFNCVQT